MVTKVTKVARFFQDKLKEILFLFGNQLIYSIIHIAQTKIPAGGGGDGMGGRNQVIPSLCPAHTAAVRGVRPYG